MAAVGKPHSIYRFHKYLMKIVVLLQGVNNLVTLCKMNLVKGSLLLLFLLPCAYADRSLSILLEGTPQTPAISGLQITTIKAGEVLEHFAFGVAQTGAEGDVLLRPDHKIRVASVSKITLAIAILILVEEQHFSLDDDVSELLGWRLRNPNFPSTPITVRSLLSHTSSVRDGARYFIAAGKGEVRDFFDPRKELWDLAAHWASEPKQQPGKYFSYANLNFGLLAEIIEKFSNERFDIFMVNRIFEPLAIKASFNPCDIPRSLLATTYRKKNADGQWDNEGPWRPQVDGPEISCFYGMLTHADKVGYLENYKLGSNATLFSPQGGLRASSSDLSVILRLLAGGGAVDGTRLLKRTSVDAILSPTWELNDLGDNGLSSGEAEPGGPRDGLMTSYGLSLHRIDMRAWGFTNGPHLLLGHLGRAYGVLSLALYDPASKDGIAMVITGLANDPFRSPGHSPLTRLEERVLHWWINHRSSGQKEAINR